MKTTLGGIQPARAVRSSPPPKLVLPIQGGWDKLSSSQHGMLAKWIELPHLSGWLGVNWTLGVAPI